MSVKSEMREELRRLLSATGMISQFICDVARSNLSADEARSLFEDVNADAEAREAGEDGGDGCTDLVPSGRKLH
jgi:hypothetical protein